MKKNWRVLDPNQSDDNRALDKLIEKDYHGSDAETIYAHLDAIQQLLARVPQAERAVKSREAVKKV